MAKIDAHQHFWIYNPKDYKWIDTKMNVLQRDFLPEHLWKEQKKTGFDGSVAVQARQSLRETEWLLELASENNRIKGVVGWIDLCSASIEEQIVKFTSNTRLVGVRHVLQDEPDDNFMLQNNFRRGIGYLNKYKLAYDILIFPRHINTAVKLVSEFPDQRFVIDHIAKPLIKDNIFSPWEKDIKALAQFPNVYCKVSGMVTEADWKKWKPEDIHPYLDIIYGAFGNDRLMIGSDWPVCTLAGSYETVMNVSLNYFKDFSENIKSKIFGDNCANFYNI
ncbi:MAG: amidohydrolase family protein [Bacteroidales bacterium]|nr:MAG: amidohydrolase family protein [Bacteroidales bacterium]